ncbi:hypothetical protein OFN53_35950, partial [Escherichia coli]|nr:hypothetical protein [Escherichia coli]
GSTTPLIQYTQLGKTAVVCIEGALDSDGRVASYTCVLAQHHTAGTAMTAAEKAVFVLAANSAGALDGSRIDRVLLTSQSVDLQAAVD